MEQTLRIPFLHANGPRSTLRLNSSKAVKSEECRQCVTSETLFGQCREICIRHCGSEYKLRITSQDKLILTK